MGDSTDPETECRFVKSLVFNGQVFNYFGELSKSTGLPLGRGILNGKDDVVIGYFSNEKLGPSIHLWKEEGVIGVFTTSDTVRPGGRKFNAGSVYYADGTVKTGLFEGLELII